MVKRKNIEIGEAELLEYLDTSSSFAFELQSLEQLSMLGFQCQHGGSYTDPVTKKRRQFDIRAVGADGPIRVRLAVECKCLSKEFPLLVLCVPRLPEESFHDLILSYAPRFVEQTTPFIPAMAEVCQTVRVEAPHSEYVSQEPIGKSCTQVGKAAQSGSVIANDAEVFGKWSQALASADDLADEAAHDGEENESLVVSLILPLLVVPDGTLWRVNYGTNGSRADSPTPVDRCSFYVGQEYSAGSVMQRTNMTVSHIEIVTLSGLVVLAKRATEVPNGWFPESFLTHLLPRGDDEHEVV